MVFINMLVKVDDCSLLIIDSKNEEGVIKMIVSVWFLDFRDDNNDGDVWNFDVRCFFIIIFEFKNIDEFKGRDI